MTNIAGIKRPGSKSTFVPHKVMLHNQDQTMVLADPMNPNALYRLDLETGKVVDEWKISDNIQVNNFLPGKKFDQQTAEQTFVGTSRNAVFRIDPRLAGDKLVSNEHKDYKSPFSFTTGVTTASGGLAFATDKGEIKLFDRLGIRAKTAFSQIGEAITGIDVSADGRYIVATTKDRLLFLDTQIHEGKNLGRTGCE
jgi:outer membrane protein assembly factor BamB